MHLEQNLAVTDKQTNKLPPSPPQFSTSMQKVEMYVVERWVFIREDTHNG